MTNRCRGCGAEVIWIRTTANRRKMPIDAEPVWVLPMSGGNTFIRKDGSIVFGRKIGDAWDDDPDANVIMAWTAVKALDEAIRQMDQKKAEVA